MYISGAAERSKKCEGGGGRRLGVGITGGGRCV